MNKAYLFIISILFMSSCIPGMIGNKYEYDISLVGATDSVENIYEDNIIKIDFTFYQKRIKFDLMNKSINIIKIDWDGISLVYSGKAYRVIHKGIKFIEKSNIQTPTIIPSNAKISELIIPAENIHYSGGWNIDYIFPIYDQFNEAKKQRMLALKGTEFSIYFPMHLKQETKEYTFKFKINDVIQLTQTKQNLNNNAD